MPPGTGGGRLALDAQRIGFLGYSLDSVARTLTAPDGSDVALHGRAFEVLVYLIEHHPRVVGKDELLAAVWPDRVVEENNLGQAIASLRRLVGTGAGDRRFIRTVPGRGYGFVADVEEHPRAAPDQAMPSPAMPPQSVQPQAMPTPPAAPVAWWRRRVGIPVSAAVVLLALLAVVGWHARGRVADAPQAAAPIIAVLPFRPLDAGPRDEMLELGIAETVIARLSHATRLRVLSLGSVQAMAGKAIDPRHAGASLGADFVLEGRLQRSGDSVRVTARLLAMPDGRTLWAETFDRRQRKVFELQDAIASGVAATLSQNYRASRRSAGCYGDDPVAYRAYLRGYQLIGRPGPRTVEAADAAFHEAFARDPQCARALAGISQAARLRVMVSDGDPEVEFPNAEAAVARALQIDPGSAEAHSERGALRFWYRWDWAGAEAAFRRAIELDPNLVNPHITLAHLYANLQRHDLAAAEARIAVALDPLSPIVNSLASSFIQPTGRKREADVHLAAALELEPDFWVALMYRGMGAMQRGDMQAAGRDLRRSAAEAGRSARILTVLALYEAVAGRPEQTRAILAELQARRAKGEYILPSVLAQVHLALGEKRQAMDLLELGYGHGDLGMAFLDVWFAELAGEPRYTTLLRSLRLPPPRQADAARE